MSVDGRLDVNVALNRPACQSSTSNDLYAYYVNDGNNDTTSYAKMTVQTNPWWAVDLLVTLFVVGVKFTNRYEEGTLTMKSNSQEQYFACA